MTGICKCCIYYSAVLPRSHNGFCSKLNLPISNPFQTCQHFIYSNSQACPQKWCKLTMKKFNEDVNLLINGECPEMTHIIGE